MSKDPYAFVYILASQKNGTLYMGVTRDLGARLKQQKAKADPHSFTARYDVTRLVWYEEFGLIIDAIAYEKTAKEI